MSISRTENSRKGNVKEEEGGEGYTQVITERPGSDCVQSRQGTQPDPSLDKPNTLPQALCTQFLSNQPPSLCIPITGSYGRKGGGSDVVFWALLCLSSSSGPRLYLIVLHVSVGPIFQQQKRCLHIIDSSCPVKCRFSCRENHSYKRTK